MRRPKPAPVDRRRFLRSSAGGLAGAAIALSAPRVLTADNSNQLSPRGPTNAGLFDPAADPVVPGGLDAAQRAALLTSGWEGGITDDLIRDVTVGFASDEYRGGLTLRTVDVPSGTEYLFERTEGRAILSACGNPTCWRYLLRQSPSEPVSKGLFDPQLNPLLPGGLTAADRAALIASGWESAATSGVCKGVLIGFSAPELPGRVTLQSFDVPDGTEYFFERKQERAILVSCGNPTCWRYLLRLAA